MLWMKKKVQKKVRLPTETSLRILLTTQPIIAAQPGQSTQFNQQSSDLRALFARIDALEISLTRCMDEGFAQFQQFVEYFYHRFPPPPQNPQIDA